ncbi:MAG: FHA domain-containing protein [Lachnospiraceae bacterium]|nr:FHA domain-containing protein [Lachnospiraceae bacterium]
MNITYKRSGIKNYLVIEKADTEAADFREKMIIRNQIPGLLKMTPQSIDGEISYYYDIQGRVPMEALFEGRTMKYEEVAIIMRALSSLFSELERYMLSPDEVIFAPSCVWYSPDTFDPEFIYVPGVISDNSFSVAALAVFITEHVDGNDRDAAMMAYNYLECVENGYLIPQNDLIRTKDDIKENLCENEIYTERKTESMNFDINSIPDNTDVSVEEMRNMLEPKKNKHIRAYAALGITVLAAFLYIIAVLYPDLLPVILNDDDYIIFGISITTAFAMTLIMVKSYYNNFKNENDQSGKSNFGGTEEESLTEHENNTAEPINPVSDRTSINRYMTNERLEISDDDKTVLLKGPGYMAGSGQNCPMLQRDNGEIIILDHFPFIIGKLQGRVDVVLKDEGVSRIHAMIKAIDGGFYLSDLNSLNGTGLNGRLIDINETVEIKNGDAITFANTEYRFVSGSYSHEMPFSGATAS